MNPGYTTGFAEPSDLDAMVSIHMEAFDEKELSVLLGRSFVEAFYRMAITSPNTTVRVVRSDRVVAFSLAFFKLTEFEKSYRNSVLSKFPFLALKLLGTFQLARLVKIIRKTLNPTNRDSIQKVKNHHLGTIAISKGEPLSPALIMAFRSIFQANADSFKGGSSPGFWTSVFESNETSIKWIEKIAKPENSIQTHFGSDPIRLYWTERSPIAR